MAVVGCTSYVASVAATNAAFRREPCRHQTLERIAAVSFWLWQFFGFVRLCRHLEQFEESVVVESRRTSRSEGLQRAVLVVRMRLDTRGMLRDAIFHHLEIIVRL